MKRSDTAECILCNSTYMKFQSSCNEHMTLEIITVVASEGREINAKWYDRNLGDTRNVLYTMVKLRQTSSNWTLRAFAFYLIDPVIS